MDEDKAIRAAKLTLGAMLEKGRAKEAKQRAPGQIAPSKYLPGVPRAVHADGGEVTNLGREKLIRSLKKAAESVKSGAHQEMMDRRAYKLHESGHLPLQIGTRVTPPQGWEMPGNWRIHGYWQDIIRPDQYGYKLKSDSGEVYDVHHVRQSENPNVFGGGFRAYPGPALDRPKYPDVKPVAPPIKDPEREAKINAEYDDLFGSDPSKTYANGGYVPAAALPVGRLAVARPVYNQQPTVLDALGSLAGIGETARGFSDTIEGRDAPAPQDGHAGRAEAGGGMSPEAVAAYNALLEAHGQPLTVVSDYRTPSENAAAKGAKGSQHMHGNAYDIDTSDMTYDERLALADKAWEAGFRGIGFYDNNMHFDIAEPRAWGPSHSRDSIPDWARDWTANRYGYADGGKVAFMQGNHPAVPDTVYHGSAPKIATKGWTSEVDEEQTQKNRDAMDFRTFKPSEYGNYGPGIYLTDKPGTASQYAMGIRADQNEEKPYGQVMKLHVSMKQPFTDDVLKHPAWRDYIKEEIKNSLWLGGIGAGDRAAAAGLVKKLDDGTATVRDLFLTDTENGTMVNQFGHDRIHKTIRNSGFDGIIGHRPDGSKEIVAFKPEQVKSAISARKFDPTNPDMTFAEGGAVPQKTVKAYKLFRIKGDGKLYPLFVNADKPVPVGEWLEAEEGPQGKAQGKVKSKLGDLAYRPGWHAGDLPIATHIGGKSDPSLKKPDYRPDNHVWAEVEMAADKDWQSVADSRGKGVKAHITDQVPLGGFYRYKTNPNMTGNWLIGGNMKVNRVLSDDEVKAINDAAGTADLPRLPRGAFAAGGAAMFEGIHEDLQDEHGNPLELWHGTPQEKEFEAFDDEKLGKRDAGFYGRGHYLTPDLEGASEYAGSHADEGTVMGPLHAALKNPYIWDTSSDNASHRTLRDLQSMGIMREKSRLEPWDNLQRHHIEPFMSEMKKRGHDGVVVRSTSYDDRPHQVSEVVVFNPNMIKHKDAEVFDPNDPRIRRAEGGEVDDNTPIDMTTARLLRNFNQNSTGPTPQAEGVFNRLADRYEKSRVAYDAAKADGVFDRVQIGDVYKYKPLPNTSPMEVVGHRMMPVERWSGDKPPKYVYHDHYPVADIKKDGETKPYSIERMEDADLYDRIKGKPRMVRADGGMVDKALAATRSFTKDGGAAIMRLKD